MVILLRAPTSRGQVGPQEIPPTESFIDRVPVPVSVKWLIHIIDDTSNSLYSCMVMSHGKVGSSLAPHSKYASLRNVAESFVPPTIDTRIQDGFLELVITNNNEDHPITCSASRTCVV